MLAVWDEAFLANPWNEGVVFDREPVILKTITQTEPNVRRDTIEISLKDGIQAYVFHDI